MHEIGYGSEPETGRKAVAWHLHLLLVTVICSLLVFTWVFSLVTVAGETIAEGLFIPGALMALVGILVITGWRWSTRTPFRWIYVLLFLPSLVLLLDWMRRLLPL